MMVLVKLEPLWINMPQCRSHQRRQRHLIRNPSPQSIQHIRRLVVRVIIRRFANLHIRDRCREDGLEMLDVLDGRLENGELVEVIFVDAGWDEMFELEDLVVDPLAATAFNGRVRDFSHHVPGLLVDGSGVGRRAPP